LLHSFIRLPRRADHTWCVPRTAHSSPAAVPYPHATCYCHTPHCPLYHTPLLTVFLVGFCLCPFPTLSFLQDWCCLPLLLLQPCIWDSETTRRQTVVFGYSAPATTTFHYPHHRGLCRDHRTAYAAIPTFVCYHLPRATPPPPRLLPVTTTCLHTHFALPLHALAYLLPTTTTHTGTFYHLTCCCLHQSALPVLPCCLRTPPPWLPHLRQHAGSRGSITFLTGCLCLAPYNYLSSRYSRSFPVATTSPQPSPFSIMAFAAPSWRLRFHRVALPPYVQQHADALSTSVPGHDVARPNLPRRRIAIMFQPVDAQFEYGVYDVERLPSRRRALFPGHAPLLYSAFSRYLGAYAQLPGACGTTE